MPYAAAPNKNEISATPSPTNAAANAGFGKLWDMLTSLFGTTGKPGDAYAAMKLLDSKMLLNLKPTFGVAANALTITLKDKDAAALSEDNPGFVSQRHATIGDGGFFLRKVAANVAMTVSSGSTLGHTSAVLSPIYIYLIDNAGTQELAASGKFFGERGIVTTVAEGGAGAADSATTMYSTTARANVSFRLVAIAYFSQAVAGNWVNLPTLVEMAPFARVIQTPVIAAGRNIKARTNAGTPASQIDIDADELVLKDSNGDAYLASAVNLTLAITAAGANGLDTGAEAANTWYYGWVIYNPTTDTVAGLLSTSATAPTMPAGYTHKALVTAVRNDGASTFIQYHQRGNRGRFELHQSVLIGGTATTETAVTITAVVPPIAHTYTVLARCRINDTSGASAGVQFRYITAGQIGSETTSGTLTGINVWASQEFEFPNEGQVLTYSWSLVSGDRDARASIVGFTLPGSGQ